jgi:anaerobic ribonucleoside-triphosphate reductase activating protein
MRIAGIIDDDIVDSDDGIAVSLWTVGCPHHCKGCHNQNLWDYDAGQDIPIKTVINEIKEKINKNGVMRNFSVLGGEPLDPQNVKDVLTVLKEIRAAYPNIKIYLWTGYTLEELQERKEFDEVLKYVDILIEGRFVEDLKQNLPLRGSSNQRVFKVIKGNYSQELVTLYKLEG